MRFLLMFVLVFGLSSSSAKWKPQPISNKIPRNALTCDICKAIMTGIGKNLEHMWMCVLNIYLKHKMIQIVGLHLTRQSKRSLTFSTRFVRYEENTWWNVSMNFHLSCLLVCWHSNSRGGPDMHGLPQQQHARHHRVNRARGPQPRGSLYRLWTVPLK